MMNGRGMHSIRPFLTHSLVLLWAILASLSSPASARNQWEIQKQAASNGQAETINPANAAAVGSHLSTYPQSLPKINPGFWQGQSSLMANRVNSGTVLTGVLEQSLSSRTSRPGDAFSIMLRDGFVQNGMQVIPAGSRVLGAVTVVTPAKVNRHGHPGSIQVSIQSLVFPNGDHVAFHGFIDANPNHAFKNPPLVRHAGQDLRDFGQSVSAMFGQFTTGFGPALNRLHRGNDFNLAQGELIPLRLTRTLEVPQIQVSALAAPAPVPGTVSASVPGPVPASAPPYGQVLAPSPVSPQSSVASAGSPLNTMPDPF